MSPRSATHVSVAVAHPVHSDAPDATGGRPLKALMDGGLLYEATPGEVGARAVRMGNDTARRRFRLLADDVGIR